MVPLTNQLNNMIHYGSGEQMDRSCLNDVGERPLEVAAQATGLDERAAAPVAGGEGLTASRTFGIAQPYLSDGGGRALEVAFGALHTRLPDYCTTHPALLL